MTKKWNMIIDISRCMNCRNCFLATKDEHIGNDFPSYAAAQPAHGHNWIDVKTKERGRWPIVEANFMPVMCNHCDHPPCMKAARGGAVSKRPDGIVIIDPVKSRGQKEIVDACPYGALFWNEEEQIPQGWIFDAHLLDKGWKKTRAEQVCAMDVFQSVKVEDEEMQRVAREQDLEVLQPEIGSKPRVWYRNLHLVNRCFVSATVVTRVGGVEDCAENAEVVLRQNDREVARARTDLFGEFKIDRLEQQSGQYELEVESAPHGSARMVFEMGEESLYLGLMTLAAET
jgi:Fe-S-cluster-containing dehydrogenase component